MFDDLLRDDLGERSVRQRCRMRTSPLRGSCAASWRDYAGIRAAWAFASVRERYAPERTRLIASPGCPGCASTKVMGAVHWPDDWPCNVRQEHFGFCTRAF